MAGSSWGQIVTRVIDGDTVVLDDQRHVRLRGIDAPELSQPWGREAKRWLEVLALGREVVLINPKPAAYGRVEASLQWQEVGINATMLQVGAAWVDIRYSTDPNWVALQTTAAGTRTGLWATDGPVPPWEWRQRRNPPRPAQLILRPRP
jgi:endonuclease YncB( thermonuclease family)